MRIAENEPTSLEYGHLPCNYQKTFRNDRDSGIYGRPLNLFMRSMVRRKSTGSEELCVMPACSPSQAQPGENPSGHYVQMHVIGDPDHDILGRL